MQCLGGARLLVGEVGEEERRTRLQAEGCPQVRKKRGLKYYLLVILSMVTSKAY